jgi:hypothetical protein
VSQPLVIYTHGAGRLGNQVMRFLHWIAWVRANDGAAEVLNLAFWQTARFFSVWNEHRGCVFPVQGGRADRLARLLSLAPEPVLRFCDNRWLIQRRVHRLGYSRPGAQAIQLDDAAGEQVDLEGPGFFERVRAHPLTTCAGWRYSCWDYVAQQQDELRALFGPAMPWRKRCAEFIANLRTRYDLVVGVQIRQSDYSIWHDGRFLFSTAQYARWIRQLLDLYPGRNIVAVIASEVWQDPRELEGLPCVFAPGARNVDGHPFDSYVTLSLCDLIVCPPSTFSATAAFIGAIPLLPVVRADQDLNLQDLLPNALIDGSRHPVFSLAVR